MSGTRNAVSLIVAAALLCSCRTLYYGAMKKLGHEKRDILVDRIEGARDAQKEASAQFRSAYEAFAALVASPGEAFEARYRQLERQYERARGDAQRVRERINLVERTGNDLFREWKAELRQYSDRDLRAQSETQLRISREQLGRLVETMRGAAAKMDPVLTVLGDKVLFVKHNLNARAVANVGGEVGKVELQVSALIRDLDRAIAEADAFLADLRGTP